MALKFNYIKEAYGKKTIMIETYLEDNINYELTHKIVDKVRFTSERYRINKYDEKRYMVAYLYGIEI